jgi:transketolase
MPSWELFAQQDDAYRASVLPAGVTKVSVEAAVKMGWAEWVDHSISIERFGASAPGPEVLEHLGFSAEKIAERVRELIG